MQQYQNPPMPTSSISPVDRVYSNHVNPQWVKLLRTLDMNQQYGPCLGTELHTLDGRRILDFLSGYCVHNTGHNHPAIVEALKEELDRCGPVMLQSNVPVLAAELARRLSHLAGGGLERVLFTNSGSEGVESAIKFARANTRRSGILFANGGFHGLTCGALSLMSDPFWSEGFGPMLPGTKGVPFGELETLERELATRKYAAFIVEPVQSEAGIRIPEAEYLRAAQQLCHRYGSLFVLDEVQTGMYRTGQFLAAHHFGVEPDMVILAKALSGGLVPVGAVLMTEKISDSVYASLQRALVHTSTFGENSLAMRAGLATLDVLEGERLGERGQQMGADLRDRLRTALAPYDMVADVRGLGMLSGIEFQAPRQLRTRVAFETFRRVHPATFSQVLVMRLFRDHGILTQVCGNNFMVLKAAPPLNVTEEQTIEFVAGVRDVVVLAHESAGFWSEALGLARRALDL
jgi:ornithine--oxo-acid transaminase